MEEDQDRIQERLADELAEIHQRIAERKRLEIQRRQTEAALWESEERYRRLVETSPDAVLLMDLNAHILVANLQAAILYGYESMGEIFGKNALDLVASEDRPRAAAHLREIREAGGIRNVEYTLLKKDGTLFPVEVQASLVVDAEGSPQAILGIIRDITERKQREEALRRSETQFHAIFERAAVGIAIVDTQGRFMESNLAFQGMLGYSGEDLRQMTFPELAHPEDRAVGMSLHRELLEGKRDRFQMEKRYLRKDGQVVWGSLTVSLVRDESGAPLFAIGVVEDITARKRAEEEKERMQAQLIRSQRMESIGRLAGGIAHDFNNLLTIIQGRAHLMMISLEESDPLYRDLEEIHRASARAAALVRQLLFFSSKQPVEFAMLDLNRAIEDLLKMLRRLLGEDITLHTDLASDLWAVQADKGNLDQVILNLAVNARDAMPEGGRIVFKTENVALDEEQARRIPEARPGRFVRLSVADTGVGMDPEVLAQIFEPFFTTKEAGTGTGLGLSVVYGIVEQHQGWIQVYSEPGRGSTFQIYLPAFLEERKPAEEEAPEAISLDGPPGRNERILLVEDEEGVRALTARVLREHGYRVWEAADGREALERFEEEQGAFDLLFVDVVLPDRSGLQLLEQICERYSHLCCLFSSGYTDQRSRWSTICEKGFRFIQKPYALSDLLRVLREVIEAGPRDPSPESVPTL